MSAPAIMLCICCNCNQIPNGAEFCDECVATFDLGILDRVRRFVALEAATEARVLQGPYAGMRGRIVSVGTPFTYVDVGRVARRVIVDNMDLEPLP